MLGSVKRSQLRRLATIYLRGQKEVEAVRYGDGEIRKSKANHEPHLTGIAAGDK